MLDHIGTNRISIRRVIRNERPGISISNLNGNHARLDLTAEEWFDLVGLVLAIKSASDFQEIYETRTLST